MKKVIIRILIAIVIACGFLVIESKLENDDSKYDDVEVYITQVRINENEEIKSNQVKTIVMPSKYIYGNYIDGNSNILGKIVKNSIESGTMLSPFMLKDENSTYIIEPSDEDHRLITIKFDEEHSNGYMIQKNQLVDLVYASKETVNQGCIRLENIEIREIFTEDLGNFIGGINDNNYSYIYVCFEVSKAIDEFLIKELPRGKVHISIRKNQ